MVNPIALIYNQPVQVEVGWEPDSCLVPTVLPKFN